jgi:hypothetical protein
MQITAGTTPKMIHGAAMSTPLAVIQAALRLPGPAGAQSTRRPCGHCENAMVTV